MSKDDIVIGAGFKQLTSCFSIGLQYGERTKPLAR
jgi:hypothetical protein